MQRDANAGPEVSEVVRRAQAGDTEAFAVLIQDHERMVLRTALRLLGRLDLAQDAAQEAFLRFHRHLGRFDPRREVGPWLYRIVVNAARDVSRRTRREPSLSLTDVQEGDHESLRVGAETLETEIERARERQRLQAALVRLPLKERAAIVLRDIEGLTTAEVATALGSSEGTVRSQICSARTKLRRWLGEGSKEKES